MGCEKTRARLILEAPARRVGYTMPRRAHAERSFFDWSRAGLVEG